MEKHPPKYLEPTLEILRNRLDKLGFEGFSFDNGKIYVEGNIIDKNEVRAIPTNRTLIRMLQGCIEQLEKATLSTKEIFAPEAAIDDNKPEPIPIAKKDTWVYLIVKRIDPRWLS